MSTMGMTDVAYYISWIIPELVMGALHAILLTATARAFQFQMVRGREGGREVIWISIAHLYLVLFR